MITFAAKSISKVMEVLFIIAFIVVVSIYIYFDHQRSLRYREKMEKEAMMHDEERANAIAKMNTLIFVNEVKHQAALVGDQATIDAVDADTYDGPSKWFARMAGSWGMYRSTRPTTCAG